MSNQFTEKYYDLIDTKYLFSIEVISSRNVLKFSASNQILDLCVAISEKKYRNE